MDQIRANYSDNVSFVVSDLSVLKRETESKLKRRRGTADGDLTDLERVWPRPGYFPPSPLRRTARLCRRSRSQRGGDGHISQAEQWMSPRQQKAEELLGGVSSLISEWAGLLMYL